MSVLTKEKLEQLATFQGTNCVSIYIPTHRRGKEVNERHDHILLKNHYQEAKNHIKDSKNIPENEVKSYLQPIHQLIEDTEFWRYQEHGLAVFLGNDFFEFFKLPYPVDEYSLVSNSFQLDQLIPLFSGDDLYYILAVSQNKVRLLEATRDSVKEIDTGDTLQQGIIEVYKYYDFEKGFKSQSSSQGGGYPGPGTVPKGGGGPNPSGNRGGATFHGHGDSPSDNDHLIKEYFRNLNEGLSHFIRNDKTPVVLAAVDYLHPIFKDAAKSFNIYEKGIVGNYERSHPNELHEKSLEILMPYWDEQIQQLRDKYQEMAGTGKASYQIDDIAPAALDGRIDTLFVVKGTHKWGVINREDNSVTLHDEKRENDKDLVSKAAIDTILNGGQAYYVDREQLPEDVEDAELAAVFRW